MESPAKATGETLRILAVTGSTGVADRLERTLAGDGLRFTLRGVDREETFSRALLDFDPDVVVSEHALPCFSGVMALARARRERPNVPFLLLTDAIGDERASEALKAGATDIVLMTHLGRLPQVLRRALRESRLGAARRRAEEALRRNEARTHRILHHALDAFVMMDGEGVVREWNPQAERTFGWERTEAVGRPLADLIVPEESRDRHREGIRRFLSTGRGLLVNRRIETIALHRDGHSFPVELAITPLREGATLFFSAFLRDITDRKRVTDQLRHEAFHDPLTGLPNRVLFRDRLGQAVRRFRRGPESGFAVIFLDVDGLKAVNDRLGHPSGDALLKEVAGRLVESVRPGDTVARLGGDEFTILLEEVTRAEEAAQAADRILAALRPPLFLEEGPVHVTASLGITLGRTEHERPDDVLREADQAMYRAKGRGGACHDLFAPAG